MRIYVSSLSPFANIIISSKKIKIYFSFVLAVCNVLSFKYIFSHILDEPCSGIWAPINGGHRHGIERVKEGLSARRARGGWGRVRINRGRLSVGLAARACDQDVRPGPSDYWRNTSMNDMGGMMISGDVVKVSREGASEHIVISPSGRAFTSCRI